MQIGSGEAPVSSGRTIFLPDLFSRFKTQCGQCHVEIQTGTKFPQIKDAETFAQRFDDAAMATMKSDDPAKFMPPPALFGKPYSQRRAGDPIFDLVADLELWMARGKPRNPFTLAASEPIEGANRYLVTPEIAEQFTNLGNSIPNKAMVGTETKKMDELDALFEKATELPGRLEETDFVALDSDTLSRHGVLSFAPGYPLFSDFAGKMRYVRVPRGKSIVFDKAKQQFVIPPQHALLQDLPEEGHRRGRAGGLSKIETRLIVTRPDKKGPNDTWEPTALFGTYLWNEDETEAVLLRDTLRNGKPFTDRVLTYVVDLPKLKELKTKHTDDLQYVLENRLPESVAPLRDSQLRTLHRVPHGQPQRRLRAGIHPAANSPAPHGRGRGVRRLGSRRADPAAAVHRLRDDHRHDLPAGGAAARAVPGQPQAPQRQELTAQGYMLGNCAGCHNPRGFPSMKSRDLATLLNFLPGAGPDEGIFEFPLERYSPRIKRGQALDEQIPYITPSLRDFLGIRTTGRQQVPGRVLPEQMGGLQRRYWDPFCQGVKWPRVFIDAPWRSLIYRNVDTPFTYSDDFAIFPKMPRNAPGFDCRAPQSWPSG